MLASSWSSTPLNSAEKLRINLVGGDLLGAGQSTLGVVNIFKSINFLSNLDFQVLDRMQEALSETNFLDLDLRLEVARRVLNLKDPIGFDDLHFEVNHGYNVTTCKDIEWTIYTGD